MANELLGLWPAMLEIEPKLLAMQKERTFAAREKTGRGDIVTEGDLFAEEVLEARIMSEFPDDGVSGEEGARGISRSGYLWYLDPIDGTTNFSKGLPMFGISAGRATIGGKPVAGILHFPRFGKSLSAEIGDGAYDEEGNDVFVVSHESIEESLVIGSLGLAETGDEFIHRIRMRSMNVINLGSFTYEASLVIFGHAGACFHTGVTQFDIAAAVPIAMEAGCVVSRLDGTEIDLREKITPILISANRSIHSAIVGEWVTYQSGM